MSLSQPETERPRSDAWGLLVFFTWVLVALALVTVVALVRAAWDIQHPIVIAMNERTVVFGDMSGWTETFLTLLGLSILGSVPLGVLVVGVGLAAVPQRRQEWLRLGGLALSVGALLTVMLWWSIDHEPDFGDFVPVGSGYYLIGGALTLGLVAVLLLVVFQLIRPVAVRRVRPPLLPAAGWYPDPDGRQPWRWWDGTAWAEGSGPQG